MSENSPIDNDDRADKSLLSTEQDVSNSIPHSALPSPVLTVTIPKAGFGISVNPGKWQEKEPVCDSSASPKAAL